MHSQNIQIQRYSKNLSDYTLYAVSGTPTINLNARDSLGTILASTTITVTGTTDASTGASTNSLTNLWLLAAGSSIPAPTVAVEGRILTGTPSVGFCAPEYLRNQTARVICYDSVIYFGQELPANLLYEPNITAGTLNYSVYAGSSSTLLLELYDENKRILWGGSTTVTSTASSLYSLALLAGVSTTVWRQSAIGLVRVSSGGPIYVNTGANEDGSLFLPASVSSVTQWTTTGSPYQIGAF